MQIKSELGGKDLTKLKATATHSHSNEGIDISSKISTLFKELNDMEAKSNKVLPCKKDYHGDKINTKNINEFKLSVMIKNKLHDDKYRIDSNEIMQNQINLMKHIKNPNNLISERTKECMDRLLDNEGMVDKKISQGSGPAYFNTFKTFLDLV